MNKKGFTLIELISSIVILALILLIILPLANNIAKMVKSQQKNNIIDELEVNGARYAFDSGETIFFVEDLLMYGYMDNEENKIEDPTDNSSMNCYAIKASKVGDYYKATFTSEEFKTADNKCDRTKLKEYNTQITITSNNGVKDNEWMRLVGDVTLTANIKNSSITCSNFVNNGASRCVWSDSNGSSIVGSNIRQIQIPDNSLINSRYNFQLTMYEGEINILHTSFAMKIDNQKPEFSNLNSKYDSTTKTYRIIATDGMGSGIAGYYLGSTTSNCASATYQESNVINNVNKGNYKACIKDKVGNILEVNVTI